MTGWPEDRFAASGRFAVDGVGLDDILACRPTPCYVYSASAIRAQLARLRRALPGFTVCYSLKANPNPAICRLLAQAGAGGEVSSAAELGVALGAGMKPEDVVLVGPAKTDAEIRDAVAVGIHAVVVDSASDLARVDEAAGAAGRVQRVLLRVNTREQPEAREVMVGGPGKFGFDEEDVVEQVREARPRRARISGIQVYSASGVLDAGFLCSHLAYVRDLAMRLSSEAGFRLETIDFGGGFGVRYAADEPELDLEAVARAAAEVRGTPALEGCRMLVESGRFIVAEAGVFLTRVERVKASRGKTFVITDSGMNGFSRPVFMRVAHPVRLLNRFGEEASGRYEVCGPICTPIDCLGSDVPLPEPAAGDIVGLFNAGAYGFTMSLLGFMSRGVPAELLVDRGSVSAIVTARNSAG